MSETSVKKFKLKKNVTLGSIAAENDTSYLFDCFIDTGDYDTLTAPEDDRCIVLGRTGSGKSALIEMVKHREENIIDISPEELSLNYISHSNVISLLEECDVNLDPFYQLLWKHVFVIELIKKKYRIIDERGSRASVASILSKVQRDKSKELAINYLTKWHDKFWLPVEDRIKEITQKIEKDLEAKISADSNLGFMKASGQGSFKRNFSREEKELVRNRVQKAVDDVQIQELHRVIKLLGENILTDPQQVFYITIDKLDENWVEDTTRFKLIRALINTVITFRKVRTVKFIISMRNDLLQTLFSKTRDSRYQEEKFKDYMLTLRWNEDELEDLLDSRIGKMYQRQYEKIDAKFTDLFPSHIGSQSTMDWFLERSLMRPRDIILYSNLCLEAAAGKPSVSAALIRDTEVEYSRLRKDNICQEWKQEYPSLETCLELLKKKKNGFTHSDLSKEDIDHLTNEIYMLELAETDSITDWAIQYLNKDISRSTFINRLFSIFYITGVIGIKRDGHESAIWSYKDSPQITETEVKRSSHFYVSPILWRTLGIHVHR